MNLFEGKKFILVGLFAVLLLAIPLTVYFVGQNQETRSRAQKATTLYFSLPGQTTAVTTPIQKAMGDSIPLDIVMDPGTNQVSFIKLTISYDATKLSVDTNGGIKQNDASFPSVLEGPTYSEGTVSMTLSIGADTTKIVQTPTKIATLTLKEKDTTNSTPTQIKFLDGQTQVLSIASSDQPSENVLSSTTPVSVSISSATTTTTAATGSASTTPTLSPTISTSQTTNKAPVCTTLTLDKSSGAAPLTINATATGNDTDGTISKVTFNFGDGPVVDITQSGGIGTGSVSVSSPHTYANPGTYQIAAILTDNKGGISSNSCVQMITVNNTASISAIPTQPPVTPTIPSPGPGNTLLSVGMIGAIISIIGALTFFAL